MNTLYFILISLAVWRITSLLVIEEGPWNIFLKLRRSIDSYNSPLNCFWCMSVWVALPFAFYYGIIPWLAISALAILFDEVINRLQK
jgi:hypothetical protein